MEDSALAYGRKHHRLLPSGCTLPRSVGLNDCRGDTTMVIDSPALTGKATVKRAAATMHSDGCGWQAPLSQALWARR